MTTRSRRQADDPASRLETPTRRTDLLGGGSAWSWGRFDVGAWAWSPAVDLIDREREVVVRADVPGLDREDIQVTGEPRRLHLRGTRGRSVDSSPGDSYHCVERWCGTFARTIGLPVEVDPPHMTATVQHGVLEVRLPKRVHATGQEVDVQPGAAARVAGHPEPPSVHDA
jgi:HSP20 family molecular chaperone IbpA